MKARWIILLSCCLSLPALAETEHLLPGYAAGASGESELRRFLRRARQGAVLRRGAAQRLMSCTTCHTADPRQPGKTPAHRKVDPLAPAANPERFTDLKKVEKWFRRTATTSTPVNAPRRKR